MREIIDHDFVASGEYFRDKSSIPVIIHGTYSEFEHKPIKCLVSPDKAKQNFQPSFDTNDLWTLKGIAQDGENVWISELSFVSSHGSHDSFHWEGTAEYFVKGNLEEFNATDGKIYCNLFIPPTPLAQTHGYICDYDGTIHFENPTMERKGISWNTKYGDVELIDGYSYAKHQVGINKAIIRVQRCQISFEIHSKESISLGNLLRDCVEVFDDSLWLISLLSRKRLAWYAGEAMLIPDDNVKIPFRKATIHRNLHLGYESTLGYGEHESDLLIAPNKLKTELFQELLTNYTTSEYHGAIQRAIIYVLMSYEEAYFEAHMGMAYLALETLVAGLSPSREKGNTKLLASASFKLLATQLKQVISKEVNDKSIAIGLIENLDKINSTKPRSFASRLLSLLQQYKVPINRLWPSGINIDKKVREIIGRRDSYIHEGEISDFDEYWYDFVRLRTLVELWILKLLNCPDDVIDQHYLTSLAPIDRIESPGDKG